MSPTGGSAGGGGAERRAARMRGRPPSPPFHTMGVSAALKTVSSFRRAGSARGREANSLLALLPALVELGEDAEERAHALGGEREVQAVVDGDGEHLGHALHHLVEALPFGHASSKSTSAREQG
ncbi:MAG: hypothetical protein U0235_30700 [Polyangiaceae bacterium]